MADEVRRSGRATKGQHTKNDTPEPQSKKGKGRGRKAQKQESEEPEEEEEAIIRCVCGYTVEDKRDKRAMVCCDSCEAWQHNIHMGLSEDDDDLPEQYFCEQCRPNDHKELLEAIARGEKIWETREQEAKAQKVASRKKGKGGRKSVVAMAAPATSTTAAAATSQSAAVASPNADKDDAARASTEASTRAPSQELKTETGQKRKLPEQSAGSPGGPENAAKMRKTSVSAGNKARTAAKADIAKRDSKPPLQQQQQQQQGTPLQMELVENVGDLLDSNRKKAALALSKLFTEVGKAAIEAGTFKVPGGSDLASFAQKLALNVEYAMFMLLWGHEETPKPEYGMQMRQILHNVKHNEDLRDRLLNSTLSPNELCQMSSEDMASKELLKKTAEMKKKVEQQSVLVRNQEPIIRRTHKGEEVIEPANQSYDGATASTFRRPKRINTDAENENGSEAASPGSPNAVELPADVNKVQSPADVSKLSIDTQRRRRSSTGLATGGRKPSASFDVDKVWSSVESPGTPARPSMSHHRTGSNANNAQTDPDIARLLKDDNDDEEEYSPADYSDPDTIWGGGIVMATVADFRATAKYAAGADLSRAYPWTSLMPDLLSIAGRIDIESANTYLCGLQYSKTSDLTVVSVSPADHQDDKDAFNRVFDYLATRKRYGVIKSSPVPQARDIYVIPLESGSGGQPEFVELLMDNMLPAERKNRMLLIAYVIKCTPKLENAESAASATSKPSSATHPNFAAASPITGPGPGNMYRTPSAPNSQMSPIAPPLSAHKFSPQPGQGPIPANPYASSPTRQQGFAPPPAHPTPMTIPQNPYATQSLANPINRTNQALNAAIPSTNSSNGGGGGGGLTGMAAAIHILGDMANSPAISQLLVHSPNVGVNELGHVKEVFQHNPETRSSLEALLPWLQKRIAAFDARA